MSEHLIPYVWLYDIKRFESAKRLVGYAGLGTSVHDSGQTHKHGRITKQGRSDLRHALVEAAWVAVRVSPVRQVVYLAASPGGSRRRPIGDRQKNAGVVY